MKIKAVKAAAIVLGAAPLLLVMTPGAGASAPRASVALETSARSAARPATSTLPKVKIKGSPASFVPTAVSATATLTGSSCVQAQASFNIKNKESVTEKFTITGTDGLIGGTAKLRALTKGFICVSSGYTGVMTLKLKSDGKTATVTF